VLGIVDFVYHIGNFFCFAMFLILLLTVIFFKFLQICVF
jgi:hypothetical protein